MGYTVLTHSDFDFHTGIIDFTENFYYPTNCLTIAIWIVEDLDADYLA